MTTVPSGTLLGHIRKLTADRCLQQETDRQLLDDFAAGRDEAAFTALVSRHGPMVLRVCRRVLNHEQDAEDAFQATFLVLARNTRSIRKRDMVGDWLHGVAYRTAMKAKRTAARRRNHEARLQAVVQQGASPSWDEAQPILEEEVQRLPQPFRCAFVLCVLEGKSGPEAAAELGCKEGTVKSRVNRARRLLQGQLARRGIHLTALLAALSVTASAGRAALPASLARSTVSFGLLVAAGESAAGVIPSHIAVLAAGVTRAMFLTKAKTTTALLLAVSLIAGAAVFARPAAGQRLPEVQSTEVSDHKPGAAGAKPQTAEDRGAIAYGGRVLGPDGRPVAGAKLYLTLMDGYYREPFPAPEQATTGADGRFEFTMPKAKFGARKSAVAAIAANHGVGWVEVPADGKRDNLTLRLVKDLPITGQVVDLEGKPVAGATLHVLGISAAPGEDLGPWLDGVQGKKGGRTAPAKQGSRLDAIDLAKLSLKVTTDAEGRFRLTGLGRNRLVRTQLDGPTIASEYLHVMTRPGKSIEATEYKGQPKAVTYYAASFRHAAAPTKVVVGVVSDKDTGKPLVGVTVESNKLANDPVPGRNIVQTTTDSRGRYRLTGLPKGEGNKIRLVPRDDQPYLSVHAVVPDSPGLAPVTIDFELKRGVWIEGKLTDKVTGKPVQGSVDYFAMDTNLNVRDHPGFDGTIPPYWGVTTKEDGSFRVVGLPGPGLIAVFYTGHHLLAPDRDDEYGTKERVVYTSPRQLGLLINYTALARIDPAKGVGSVKRNITLDPGWTFMGTVLGPDGKPLAGARGFGLTDHGWSYEAMKTAEFTVQAFNPSRPRDVLFQHPEKGLVGVAQPPKKNGGSVTVRLQPGATVTGRLVDADGKPQGGVELVVTFRAKAGERWRHEYSPERIKTDRAGRFRVEGLLPGYEFRLRDDEGELSLGDAPRSGATKDLGDVVLQSVE